MASSFDVYDAQIILSMRYGGNKYRLTYGERTMLQERLGYLRRRAEKFGSWRGGKPKKLEDLFPPGWKPSGKGPKPYREIAYANNPFLAMLPRSK